MVISAPWSGGKESQNAVRKKGKERVEHEKVLTAFQFFSETWLLHETPLCPHNKSPLLLKLAQISFSYQLVITNYIYSTTKLS